MNNQVQDNKIALMNKIGMLDMMLDSLNKVHKDDSDKMEDMMKKISTRKLILIDELYTLLSPLSP